MTEPELDKESPSLTPHGDVIRVPGGKPKDEESIDKAKKEERPMDDKQHYRPKGDEPKNR